MLTKSNGLTLILCLFFESLLGMQQPTSETFVQIRVLMVPSVKVLYVMPLEGRTQDQLRAELQEQKVTIIEESDGLIMIPPDRTPNLTNGIVEEPEIFRLPQQT